MTTEISRDIALVMAQRTPLSTTEELLTSPEALVIVSDFLRKVEQAAAMDQLVEGDPEMRTALSADELASILLRRLLALNANIGEQE